jgi:dipeptidyl aminopeptidase/acylaminoacyl peptidase
MKPARSATAALAAALLALALRANAQPSTRPVSLDDLLSIRQVSAPQLSPDGGAVLYTVRGWENGSGKDSERKDSRTHVWRVNADGTGQRQMTFGARGDSLPSWSPDGARIAFVSARPDEGERSEEGPVAQIWVMRADGGEPRRLTDAKDAVTSYAWSPDSRTIAFVARHPLSKDADDRRKRREDERRFESDFRLLHLWTVDVTTGQTKELAHDDQLTINGAPSWAPDGRRVAFSGSPTPLLRDGRADVYIATVGGGSIEKITVNAGPDRDPVWSPDGAAIAFVAGFVDPKPLGDGLALEHIGNDHLMLYDVASKKIRDVSQREFDASPGPLHWSADGQRLLFSTGVRTAREVFTLDLATLRYTQMTRGRIATIGSIRGDRVALVIETSTEPPEVFVADGTFDAARKVTDTNPHARAFALGRSEVVSWKSDALTIEGVLLKPVGYQPGRRYPLLVVAHGGPAGAFLDNFRVGYGDGSQNWAGEGWAVLYPNPRGSSNYGEKFLRANINDWGGGDFRDIMAGVDAMIARGIADPDRLALQGWSYGGYMTAWAVSQTPRFKAAMIGAGLTSLISMYGTNDIPSVLGAYFGGIPSKDTMGLYMERSGLTHIDRVTTPVLILHGGSDERVPIGQPMEFYRALRDRGKAAELVFYPREGHGLTEYYHQLDRLRRQHDWIVRHTLGDASRKSTDR